MTILTKPHAFKNRALDFTKFPALSLVKGQPGNVRVAKKHNWDDGDGGLKAGSAVDGAHIGIKGTFNKGALTLKKVR